MDETITAQRMGDGGVPAMMKLDARSIRRLALVGLVVVVTASLLWVARAHRHRASTYGITDPALGALRIENRTTDFAITRIGVGDSDRQVASWDVPLEIAPGADHVLAVDPGSYLVWVDFVEIKQAEANRPNGSLDQSVTLTAGRATLVSLEGGRSSPDGLVYVPPWVAAK